MGHLTKLLEGFRAAASFLTRVPVRSSGAGPEKGLVWFPVVGALVGLAIGASYAITAQVLPPLVAATLAVGLGAMVTGGFHEDGLADTADAFGGGWDRDDVLRILKDPRQGTFGVLALVIVSALKIGAIASLDPWTGLPVLVAAHALSRAAAISLLGFVAPATGEGLGASYARGVTRVQIGQTALVGGVLALPLLGVWLLPAAGITALLFVGLGRWSVTKAGGLTGDVLGAAQQVAEITVLLVASAVVTNGWATIPWWHS
jgi:adenosylcobinamide-GDP ribazoletransferase